MRVAILISSSILLASCAGGEPAPKDPPSMGSPPTTPSAPATASAPATPSPPAAASPPQFKLAETPPDKLGTAPSGFGLKVGDRAPDASLPDVSGKTESLATLFSQGPTLLMFYRGGWCPYCNLQLHEYSAAKPQFD